MKTTISKQWALALFLALLASASVALAVGAANNKNGGHKLPDPVQVMHITKGPILEFVSDHTAVIAWSTNVDVRTLLRYGTREKELNAVAQTRWGGHIHRVHLTHLRPNTTYYFQVQLARSTSTSAAGSLGTSQATDAEGQVESFHTPAKGQKSEHYPGTGPG